MCGTSGLLVGPALAAATGKNLFVARKDRAASHAYRKFDGVLGRKVVIVDDFVQTGETLAVVFRAEDY